MGTFKIISRTEMNIRRRISSEDLKIFEEFKSHISELSNDNVCIYECSDDDNIDRIKKVIRKAAKAIDVKIRQSYEDNKIIFYKARTLRKKTHNSRE
jgi:hypothetical protein